MGVGVGVARVVLVVINLIFVLVSLLLIGVGAFLRFYGDKVLDLVGNFGAVKEATTKTLGITQDVTEIPFLADIGLALLIFGCVLFLVSFCACCGACGKWRPLLIALHEKIQTTLGDKIRHDYKDGSTDMFTSAINIMNYMLECCGISGYKDFGTAPAKSCCTRTTMTSNVGNCQTPAVSSDFNQKGCYGELQGLIQDNLTPLAIGLGLLLALQVVEIVFAVIVVKDASSSVGPV